MKLAQTLADMAELEQLKAMAIDDKLDKMASNQQVIALGKRDRHVARSSAFIEAARLAMQ